MGAVNTTYTFTPTDTITSTKMNNIIDETVMTSDAVLGGSGGSGGLDISSGKLSISANAINSSRLANNAITTNSITNGSITSSKIDSIGPKWSISGTDVGNGNNQSVYYLNIANQRTVDGASSLQFITAAPGNSANASITRNSGLNGNFDITNNGAGGLNIINNSGSTFFYGPNGLNLYKDESNNSNFPVPAGTAPIYGVRAWVSFDMTRDSSGASNTSNTNRFIYASGNVSSVLKADDGRFQVNFTSWMPDTYYTYYGSGRAAIGDTSGDVIIGAPNLGSKVTSSIVLNVLNSSGAEFNSPEVCVSIIR